ncbi:MAG: NAD(P)/FAD-dependent oxidoreductase [Halioglobus sp.]|nr:NAD(P)/FAD-dependent oxidoreductase [Halioglobus sp.]
MTDAECVDVLIVGAGLSGIGSARHLQRECPERSFLLLESRAKLGGTWDLFRYPGIRSDSDMYTLGYTFKPWPERKALADGPSILHYLQETAAETGVDRKIRYNHKVTGAAWSSDSDTWTVSAEQSDTGESVEFKCRFLMMCSGYYDYDKGYTPDFKGRDDFAGTIVHAQHWPEGLDYKDKRVIVIGSGATAVTLVPELARQTSKTVMLQRSPTYIASIPEEDPWASFLHGKLPESWIYRIIRWKRVLLQIFVFNLSRKRPQVVKKLLLGQVRQALGEDYDVKKHFTPSYNPWDQRLCAVPEGDLFEAVRSKRAEVVTDTIDRFTADGILLSSGGELTADIIVLATGLNLKFIGGATLSVDGKIIDPADIFVYRGMMLANVPNLVQVFGYTNASWTLKSDLTAQFVCRLLNRMRKTSTHVAIPRMPVEGVDEEPMLDFTSGYIQRAIDKFPKQGKRLPWRVYQNFIVDFINLRFRPLKDKVLQFR